MKAIKLRIYPTLAQRRQLAKEFAVRRAVWNWALDRRRAVYSDQKVSLSAVALSRELTSLKASTPFFALASATVLTYTLRDLDAAYEKFFKHHGRFPKFKKRGVVQSAKYQIDKRQNVFRDGEYLKLPKLGAIKVVWSASIPAIPNSATVSRDPCGRWFVSLQFEAEDRISPPIPEYASVGLDFGLTTIITTSRGEKINARKPMKEKARRLARYQRRLSAAKKGSNNKRKLKWRVARLHCAIGDQRKDILNKLSTSVVRANAAITIEDLNVRGMMANRCLSSAVAERGFGELRRQLSFKAAWYGRELTVIGRFERSTGVCPDCGLVGPRLALRQRTWICECGLTHDRDEAAAKVIDIKGRMARNTAGNAGIKAPGLPNKPNDSGDTRDNRGRGEGGKAQFMSPQGRGQRVPQSQGARS